MAFLTYENPSASGPKPKREVGGKTGELVEPGPDKEANWLPAPNGPFVLMMRIYWPKENPPSLLNGNWKPPPVTLNK
jgi:hypothetical protein